MATGPMWPASLQRKMNGNPPTYTSYASVANIIPGFRLVGVAPDAQVLSFKVFADVNPSLLSCAEINILLTSRLEPLGH